MSNNIPAPKLFEQANISFRNHDYETAMAMYEVALKTSPEEPLAANIRFNYELVQNRIKSISSKINAKSIASKKEFNVAEIPKFEGFGIVRHNPLVSIIIVSFNSGNDLNTLLPTLKSQTYQNFELLVLENGTEESECICAKYFDSYKHFKQNNIGFAAGNNYCYERSDGEFIAMINPDTKLDCNFLQELVDAIRYDELAAIVAPKINFYEKFISLTLEGDNEYSIDLSNLMSKLSYKKYFLRSGTINGTNIISDNNTIKIDISHPNESVSIPIAVVSTIGCKRLKVTIGYKSEWQFIDASNNFEIALNFDKESYGAARYLINNAGSGIRENGQPYDRGFGEYEDGQYLSKTYLSAFCGCAALIRKSAILARKLFIDEFFAYYEDSELSWWMQKGGLKILYCPTALIYHRHSESTVEISDTWRTLVNRSFNLYSMISTDCFNTNHKTFTNDYSKSINIDLVQRLSFFDKAIIDVDSYNHLIKNKSATVCIYNSFFSSMGGGEKHALDFAALLQDNYSVYLASEVDFDIKELSGYFGIDLSRCKKLVSTCIDTFFTSKFDVFINSTFHSNLISASELSYFIVSFPHKHIDKEVIARYHFLHNSPFTSRWANKYWGAHKSSLILPIIGYANINPSLGLHKNKLLLSVGRLTSEGHCKNHHRIIEAYKSAIDQKLIQDDWVLVIAGSCDLSNGPAVDYYHLLQRMSSGYNIRIQINISRNELERLYKSAFIYIHATGLGLPLDQPEKHEHFGITPHEAMRFGCYPVVYCNGGPSEQINGLSYSKTFSSLAELASKLADACISYSDWESIYKIVQTHAVKSEHSNQSAIESFASDIDSYFSKG
jgi:GT2 family glycosyltransferase